MSTAVEINGLSLIPIREAAVRVSYSRDYVARLAREGKIVASQVGRQWFVDLTSLEKFSAEASALEEVRKQELRAERKRELIAKESLSVLDAVVAEKMKRQRFDAAVVTVAVMCLGLFTGVGVYTAAYIPGSPLEDISDALAVVSAPLHSKAPASPEAVLPVVAEEHSTLLLSTVVEQPVFVTESETTRVDGGLSGILVMTKGAAVSTEEEVAELFSDEVSVEFTALNTGVITYGEGEAAKEYPFVRVPHVVSDANVGTP